MVAIRSFTFLALAFASSSLAATVTFDCTSKYKSIKRLKYTLQLIDFISLLLKRYQTFVEMISMQSTVPVNQQD